MKTTACATLVGMMFAATIAAVAQDAEPSRRGAEPFLRVDIGGPSSFVTALAFSNDGQTLHAGGWDKVVRVWSLGVDGRFALSPTAAFRVPIGPGPQGNINTLAISADGNWLAVAGMGYSPRVANFRESGWMLSSADKTSDTLLDEGTIYLANRQTREVHRLQGHLGPVLALAFSSSTDGNPLLASAAEESYAGESKGVVRLWQVAERKEIGATFVPHTKDRPQLSVLPNAGNPKAANPKAASVAIAWNDGTLRIWETDSKRLHEQADGEFNNSVSLLDQSTMITSSSTSTGIGQLKFWKLASGDAPQANAHRQIDIELWRKNDPVFRPRAFALIASRPGQTLDHVAVASLVLEPDAAGKYVPARMQLRLVSLQPQEFGKTVASTDLWSAASDTPQLPTLAATANGEHLAVAGGPSHEILIYSIQDLLSQQYRPQKLASLAVAMQDVAFAEKDGELGLLLHEQASQHDDFDFVFPLSSGRLEPFQAAGGWQRAAATNDWQARLLDDHIEVRHQDGRVGKVTWQPTERVTKFALAPPMPPLDVPILALATHEVGNPRLSLFNASTGKQVFQYTGHTERITALSFSPDFRLLVSASSDQTVCVWSLTDLGKVLGKRGQLLGVGVNKELEVVSVAPDSPASGLLKNGDRLAGYVVAGQFREWAGRYSFYEHWRTLAPGSELTVRRTRGDATEDVMLPVGQAIDERKPLFSLLVTRGPQLADWQWVGWNPLGPFESSDRRIERYLGWHFNTGDPARPTAYAELDQYREKYFRKGLLRDLARDGELLAEPAPAPLIRPAMSLLVLPADDEQVTAEQGAVIREPLASVQLAVDYAFPAALVQQITLQIDDQPRGEFHRDADGTWQADLPAELWQRGSHRVRAILRTSESIPQEFSEELQFRFVPAAPRITSTQPANSSTAEARLALQAEVLAGSLNEAFDVEMHRLEGEQATFSRSWKGDQPVKVNGGVPLELGTNVFELVARNRQRTEATDAEETSRHRFVVTRFQGAVSPPKIELTTLVVPTDGVQDAREIPLRLGQPVVVTTNRVRVRGSITSKDENLKLAEKFAGDAPTGQSLGQFVANQRQQYAIDDEIELVPGLQKLRYRGQTENSKAADVELAIEYRPQLPAVQITSPVPDQQVTAFAEQPQFRLEGRLTMPLDLHPYAALMHLNGEGPAALTIDERLGTFQASVPLRFGDNQIEIRVSNEWQVDSTVQVVNLAYRPAPRIVDIKSPQQVANPFLDLTISGWSETDIKQVVLNERTLPTDSYRVARKEKGFRVFVEKQPFEPRLESLAVRLYAAGSPTPAVAVITTPKLIQQPSTPAAIEFTDPARNATINDSEYTVHFRVSSPSPLRAVEFWHDGRSLFRTEAAAELTIQDGSYRKPVAVNLQPGINNFEVTAENKGGLQREVLTINHLGRPVSLIVDGIAPRTDPNQLVKPVAGSIGRVRFAAPAPSHQSLLQGKVVWNDPEDERLRNDGQQLRVWVNGHQQFPVTLDLPVGASLERRFSIPIVLSRQRDNIVEIGLPGMEREASSRFLLDVACQVPLTKQRLHVLVVGVGVSDDAGLVDRVVKALQGERTGAKDFTTAAFGKGFIYGPLTDRVLSKGTVNTQLAKINQTVRLMQKQRGEPASDVVLVYYQGGIVNSSGQFFLTTRQTNDPEEKRILYDPTKLKLRLISDDTLTNCVENGFGAWLVMLDVNRETAPGTVAEAETNWPQDSHAAMLRYAWSNDEPTPLNARLIDALNHVKSSSQRLGQLADELQLAEPTEHTAAISYERYVPEMLQELELRRTE